MCFSGEETEMHQILKTLFSATEVLNRKGKIQATGTWLHTGAPNSSSTAMLIISVPDTK